MNVEKNPVCILKYVCLLGLMVAIGWYTMLKNGLEKTIIDPFINDDIVCDDYTYYSRIKHGPYSEGPLKLSFQRPPENCRTFKSQVVEDLINDLRTTMKDPDLFRLLENTLPNTLDTAILWYNNDQEDPRTFISTGDIHAEWLRDSARQLSVYQRFIDKDPDLKLMTLGAILQQAQFINLAPYCNAFHAPPASGVDKRPSSIDDVFPRPNWDQVFECKWELDSLASFLTLSNKYLENSKDYSLLKNKLWLNAVDTVLLVLKRQLTPTFNKDGQLQRFTYSFKRQTNIGTETLPLDGVGNPVNGGTGLIRSAFRPSDDSTIYQLFIPANAQILVELKKISPLIEEYSSMENLARMASDIANGIEIGLKTHAIVNHKTFGDVYAYEIDGYGSFNLMDDANIPSLLSLPDIGYGSINDTVYQNTRKMILNKEGNPYYLTGKHFRGIGGPHVGLSRAWPMSLIVQIRTSDDDDEITELLDLLKTTTGDLGLMHEGINVNIPNGDDYTRSWFSWCNSEFGEMILHLIERKPHLLI